MLSRLDYLVVEKDNVISFFFYMISLQDKTAKKFIIFGYSIIVFSFVKRHVFSFKKLK